MNKTTKIIAAGVTAIALAGGIGAGIASADPTTPAPTPSTTATPSAKPKPNAEARKHRPLATRALHGEVTLGGKEARVVAFQRGQVDKVSATSITLTSTDGFSATYVVNDQTTVRKAKVVIGIAEVETGDRVRVVAGKDGSTLTATRVGVLKTR